MSRMNPTPAQRKFDEGRLMNVLVAPVVSEKATMVGEKSNSVTFKVLQDRFRQLRTAGPVNDPAAFRGEFHHLMDRMDKARESSVTPPERYFKRAQKKIKAGDYDFSVDKKP